MCGMTDRLLGLGQISSNISRCNQIESRYWICLEVAKLCLDMSRGS